MATIYIDGVTINTDDLLKPGNNPPDPVLDKIHRENDEIMGRVLLQRLIALGYNTTLDAAIKMYKDLGTREMIGAEYNQLELTGRMDQLIGGVESIQRELNR